MGLLGAASGSSTIRSSFVILRHSLAGLEVYTIFAWEREHGCFNQARDGASAVPHQSTSVEGVTAENGGAPGETPERWPSHRERWLKGLLWASAAVTHCTPHSFQRSLLPGNFDPGDASCPSIPAGWVLTRYYGSISTLTPFIYCQETRNLHRAHPAPGQG